MGEGVRGGFGAGPSTGSRLRGVGRKWLPVQEPDSSLVRPSKLQGGAELVYNPAIPIEGDVRMTTPNRLYFGDCLDVMREDVPDESIDLIYLDPPFNSKRLYNAFMGGAQWVAFDDTWRWHEAVDDFHDVASDIRLADTVEGLRRILGEGPQLAYLSYMTNRLRECHRVLKATGSIYLHCDPTMSHYLKVILDAVFGVENFRNEIIWKRTSAHNDVAQGARHMGRIHDTILRFSKGASPKWNIVYVPYDQEYIDAAYRQKDETGRRYQTQPLHAAKAGGDTRYEWRGKLPPLGRYWAYSKKNMERLEAEGRIAYSRTGTPRYKIYLDESSGKSLQDLWDDIHPVHMNPKERLRYPTQKPTALLERIIQASSNEGDLVLDPFCGCGTTIHAAQNLERRWVGIDICVNACKVIEQRLRSHFDTIWDDIEFIGMPKTVDDAKTLAGLDKFRFERWAASLVDGMEANTRQRGDGGIDGWGRIPIRKGQFIDMVSQVKGGSTGPGDVQAFNGARQQARADLGIFTCFDERVTPRMRDAAASTGRFMEVPTVQIYTIEDYFTGRFPTLPKAA